MDELMARMTELHARIAQGGSQKAREKHVARGKMLPREYVRMLPSNQFQQLKVADKLL